MYHIKRIMEKNHVNISVDAENKSDRILYP